MCVSVCACVRAFVHLHTSLPLEGPNWQRSSGPPRAKTTTHKGPNTTTDAAKDQPHHAKNLAPDTTLPPERKDTPRVDPTPLHHVKDRAVPEPHQVTCLDSPHPGGTQELCESRGSCPGHPVPTTPYGLCGREATLNSNHTLDWTSHEGLSTTTDTKPDATLPPRTSVQHVTWKSRTQRHACIHTPRAPDTSATRKTRETSETLSLIHI